MIGGSTSLQKRLSFGLGLEGFAAGSFDDGISSIEVSYDAERRFRGVSIDFTLSVDHNSDAYALHPTRAERWTNFAPQDRAQFKANEAIQNSASLLRIDEVGVHVARRFNGLQDGRLGDFRKYDALCLRLLQI